MKKTRALALLALLAAMLPALPVMAGDAFKLYDRANNRTYGPFDFADGQEIFVGNHTYILSVETLTPSRAEQRAREIYLPNVEMREASLQDAVDYYREAARAIAGPGQVPNIILDLAQPAPVTLNMRNVSLYEALTFTAEVAGCHIRWKDNHVVLSNR